MNSFLQSVPGRILAVAVALPLAAGAWATWAADGGMVWIIASVFAGIVLGIVGVGLAVEEFGKQAVAAVLLLPPALLLYTPLVSVAAGAPAVRTIMALASMVLFAAALGPTFAGARLASLPRPTTRSA